MEQAQHRAPDGAHQHQRVEDRRVGDRTREPPPLPEQPGHPGGARSRQDRHREHPGPDEPQREDQGGERTGHGLERRGGLSGGLDAVPSVRGEGRRGHQDDRPHHEVRKSHPGDDVHPRVDLLLSSVPAGSPLQGHCSIAAFGFVPQLLKPMGTLPEEEVGGDGRPEDGHEQGNVRAIQLNVGHDRVGQHGRPVDVNQEQLGDIGEKRQAECLEHLGDETEGAGHQKSAQQDPADEGRNPRWSGVKEIHAASHGQ